MIGESNPRYVNHASLTLSSISSFLSFILFPSPYLPFSHFLVSLSLALIHTLTKQKPSFCYYFKFYYFLRLILSHSILYYLYLTPTYISPSLSISLLYISLALFYGCFYLSFISHDLSLTCFLLLLFVPLSSMPLCLEE